MRTGAISFDGKKHILCFSVRVIKACAERYGSMEGIYEALSCENEVKNLDEALWLLEQMMKAGDKYAKEHGFQNIKFYEDDGFTGTNFNRPDMQRLLDDVEMGYVSTIIVKDMSRFGREYLQVGYYTEHYFPEKNVRFIAVNDGVDSANEEDNDFTPSLTAINRTFFSGK